VKTIDIEAAAVIGRASTKGIGTARSATREEKTLPIHLPKNVVLFLEELCAAAGIPGGLSGFVTHHFVSLIRIEKGSFCSGILMEIFDLFELPEDRDSNNVHTATTRWKLDDKKVIVRDHSNKNTFEKGVTPAIPRPHRRTAMHVQKEARPIIEAMIKQAGFYGTVEEALGHCSVPWREACDVAAHRIAENSDLRADGIAKLYGLLAVEKIRVVEFGEHPAKKSEREWVFGNDEAEKEAAAA